MEAHSVAEGRGSVVLRKKQIRSISERICSSCSNFFQSVFMMKATKDRRRLERLIGTCRRECLDRLLFWTSADLEARLVVFKDYYNKHRTHAALNGATPIETPACNGLEFTRYRWPTHCRGLYQTPVAA